MTVTVDPWWVLTMIIVLFGGGRLFLLALLAIGVPVAVLYGLFRLIKWII